MGRPLSRLPRRNVLLVVLCSGFHTTLDLRYVALGGCDAFLCLLLKCMQRIHYAGKFNRVDRAIRIPVKVINDLQDSSTPERAVTLQRLCCWVLASGLRHEKRVAHRVLNIFRKLLQASPRGSDPKKRDELGIW